MQSNIFAKLVPLLKEKKCNIDIDKFIEFMGRYQPGQWVFPSVLHRILKMKIIDIYEVLEFCAEEGLLQQYLEVYCPNCNRSTGKVFETLTDIPDTVNCIHCDQEISDPARHAIVIYRVIG